MASQTFEVSENLTITVSECLGDLTIKGAESTSVTVKTSSDEEEGVKVVQEEDALIITSKVDCKVTCPQNTTLVIDVVRGDLRVKGVSGDFTVGEVNGDLSVRDADIVTIDKVHGDLRARHVDSDLTVNQVAGDASVTGVNGKATIGQIGSDLKAGGIVGGLEANAVGSDVNLSGPFEPETTFTVRAGSDLFVRVSEEDNLRFTIQAGGGVHAQIPDVELIKEGGSVIGVMGAGEATLEAQVGGRAVIKTPNAEGEYDQDFNFDVDLSFLEGLDELGPMIEARVSEAMAHLEVQLDEGLKHIDGDRIRAHVERAAHAAERIAERATQAAERESERARRAAAREAEHSRMRAEHAERRWQRASGNRPPVAPVPPVPPVPPVAPMPPEPPTPPSPRQEEELRDERLQVLRMVEEGKISAEEAASLLSALR